MGNISKAIKTVVERNPHLEIELVIGEGSIGNIDSLVAGSMDLTIVENYVPYKDGVRAILSFYPQIMHIFHRGDYEPKSFQELVYGKKIFIGNPGSGSYRFMMDMFKFFNLDMSQFTITENAFDNEVFAGFTDIFPDQYLLGLEDYKLFSFDQIENYGNGSVAEAIALKFPQVKPFVIPQFTYRKITDKPILTVASDAILIARADLRESFVYDLTKTIFTEKQDFINISPLIYKGLTESFDRSKLSYPLHEGARVYLDRDEPGFLERYAELVGVLFSVAVALVSGLISLSKWQSQKKKDRVDVFYKDLMDIKNKINTIRSGADAAREIKHIQDCQNQAFNMLINEELEANESFRIYMELSKETIHELRGRARALSR
ncbi:MAG: hypothetical protein KI790_06530 [Cyclobacteriaceae bacterium]|nr:hypothetical protein [Cyclobacteriaceae bacterium HetDA_MAG_MS6]